MGIINGTTKAMIMAAGVGSRLDPLTKDVPKPLIPVLNIPVMDILMQKLSDFGVRHVVANTYYLAEQIQNRYAVNSFGINFQSIKETELSGTAGGFKKCQFFFNQEDTIIVLSGDGLSNVNLENAIEIHRKNGAIATIGVKEIPMEEVSKFGVVVTDENGFVTEFQEKPSREIAKSSCINTGIYIFNYKIFKYIPENTFFDFAQNVFPKLVKEHQLCTFNIDEYWTDIGSIDQYRQSVVDIFEGKCKLEKYENNILSDVEHVKFTGYNTIGRNCCIGENVKIKNCIIWDSVKIADNVTLENTIIGSNCTISCDLTCKIIGSNEIVCAEPVKL